MANLSEETKELKLKNKIPTIAKSIRLKCCDCEEGEFGVRHCVVVKSPLWPYRMGRNPKKSDLIPSKINNYGVLMEVAGKPTGKTETDKE